MELSLKMNSFNVGFSSNGFGHPTETVGMRRKQAEIQEEVGTKRHRVETPEPTDTLGIIKWIFFSVAIQFFVLNFNSLAFKSMVVYPSSKFKATLSWLVHPTKFYIQANCMLDGLGKMMEKIESLHPDSIPPMSNIAQGQPCLAKFEGDWYRGKVYIDIKFMRSWLD
jgi:Tudor domain